MTVCHDGPVRLTYANVTSSLALFIALGGTSYAVTQLPRNSVGSRQVRDGSLLRKDLAKTAVSARRGPRGAQGPTGDRGPSSMRLAPAVGGVALSSTPGVGTVVRRMADLPAGDWSLRFFGSPRLPVDVGLHVECAIQVNGDAVAFGAVVVGDHANATQESGLLIETAVKLTSTFTVTVTCTQTLGTTPAVTVNRPQIVATQVGDLVVTP